MRTILLAVVAFSTFACAKRDDYSVSGLIKMLEKGDAVSRYTAVDGLEKYGPQAKPAVQLLDNALTDTDAKVRVRAAYALAAIGPGAEMALPRLIAALKSTDNDFRLAAAYAIPAVAPRSASAAAALKPALSDKDRRVRTEAATGLRKLQLAARFANQSPAAITSH